MYSVVHPDTHMIIAEGFSSMVDAAMFADATDACPSDIPLLVLTRL